MGNVVFSFRVMMREAGHKKLTHSEYVQGGMQGFPMQWFSVGHMSVTVTFFGSESLFPSRK